MTVYELIVRLQELPEEWQVFGTRSNSIEAREPGEHRSGQRYCYVFPDGRPTQFYTVRR